MTLSPTQEETKGWGVVTNGIGQPCTSHLNLTKALPTIRERKPRAAKPSKTHFAGYDPTERNLGVSGGSWGK